MTYKEMVEWLQRNTIIAVGLVFFAVCIGIFEFITKGHEAKKALFDKETARKNTDSPPQTTTTGINVSATGGSTVTIDSSTLMNNSNNKK